MFDFWRAFYVSLLQFQNKEFEAMGAQWRQPIDGRGQENTEFRNRSKSTHEGIRDLKDKRKNGHSTRDHGYWKRV